MCGVSATSLAASSAMAQDQNAEGTRVQLPTITIFSTVPLLPSESVEDPDSPARPPVTGDGGEFLRHVNGISAGRIGGHGLEPVIRGMDQNQISITNDGAFQFGGCPNRMDPPTSHMQLYTYDKVTIKKGYQSVVDGPPAPGGTIAFERDVLNFGPEGGANIKSGGAYVANGARKESFVDMSTGNEWGYVRGFGSYATSGNYEDGHGNEIRSSFEQFGGGVILGRTFDANSWLTLKVENNNVDDAEFPGSGMDAPVTDDWTYQLKMATDLDWGRVRGVEADIYLTTVDHTMNNFDLRTNTGMRNREAIMESDTLGGKVVFEGEFNGIDVDFGADHRTVDRNGNRYDGTLTNFNPTVLQSNLWPDTSILETGLFAEAKIPVSQFSTLTAGLRYAHVKASAGRANDSSTAGAGGTPVHTPNQLYQQYYGISAKDQTENNVSALMRLEHEINEKLTVFGSLSRSVRTADATERYIASYMGMGGANSWVGNPGLDPEKHHQGEIGISLKRERSSLSGTVYYNSVDDFIQLDSARGQQGILVNTPTASVFRNIDASLAGVEVEAETRLAKFWRLKGSTSYTHGKNRSDGIALAQIAPLSGRAELTYDNDRWLAGVRLNAATKQTRVDDDNTTGSGRDNGPSDGWVTLDLFAAINLTDRFQISGGVTNVTDKNYAYHLNKTNLENPAGVRVNEPGRAFYIRGVTRF